MVRRKSAGRFWNGRGGEVRDRVGETRNAAAFHPQGERILRVRTAPFLPQAIKYPPVE